MNKAPTVASPNALLRVTGNDAGPFLQTQTTQDLGGLEPDGVRLAAWLSPQGRVQGVFDVVADGDDFWLITPEDNAEWLATALGRFILRADVAIAIDPDRSVRSLLGRSDDWLRSRGVDLSEHAVARTDSVVWVKSAPARVDAIASPAALDDALDGLAAADADGVARTAIADGRAPGTAWLRGRYTAHMLNLDRLGAVSFTKGCYPGQEIVARSENLGRVKRRLARLRLGAGDRPAPGDAIVDAAGRVCGDVVLVAAADGGFAVLAVVAIDAEALALAADGRPLEAASGPVT